jgi:hypothetical protein
LNGGFIVVYKAKPHGQRKIIIIREKEEGAFINRVIDFLNKEESREIVIHERQYQLSKKEFILFAEYYDYKDFQKKLQEILKS